MGAPSIRTAPSAASSAARVRERPSSRDNAWSARTPSRPSGTGRNRCGHESPAPVWRCRRSSARRRGSRPSRCRERQRDCQDPANDDARISDVEDGELLAVRGEDADEVDRRRRERCGVTEDPVDEIAGRAAEDSPRLIAQPVEYSLLAVRAITNTTMAARMVKTIVIPAPMPNAAPELRLRLRYTSPPRMRTGASSCRLSTAKTFVTISRLGPMRATAISSEVRRRLPVGAGAGVRLGSVTEVLSALLFGLAVHTERRRGISLQSPLRNRLAAALTVAVGACLDP